MNEDRLKIAERSGAENREGGEEMKNPSKLNQIEIKLHQFDANLSVRDSHNKFLLLALGWRRMLNKWIRSDAAVVRLFALFSIDGVKWLISHSIIKRHISSYRAYQCEFECLFIALPIS
jgi:hypothetical protein